FVQTVGNVLHEAGQDVFAGGSKRGIGVRRDDTVHPQLFGNFTELGYVIAAFGKCERGNQGVESALQRSSNWGGSRKARFVVEHQIHLGARTVHLDAADRVQKL